DLGYESLEVAISLKNFKSFSQLGNLRLAHWEVDELDRFDGTGTINVWMTQEALNRGRDGLLDRIDRARRCFASLLLLHGTQNVCDHFLLQVEDRTEEVRIDNSRRIPVRGDQIGDQIPV